MPAVAARNDSGKLDVEAPIFLLMLITRIQATEAFTEVVQSLRVKYQSEDSKMTEDEKSR